MNLDRKAWLLVQCLASVRRTDDSFIQFLVDSSKSLIKDRKNEEQKSQTFDARKDLFHQIWN